MSRARNARIGAALVGLRSPLARIELAAGQLARAAETPGARALARSISAAVGEVDGGLDAALRALAGAAAAPRCPDCRPGLEAVWRRLTALLAARGLGARLELPETEVAGDAEAVRRAAVALVGDGIARAAPGAHLTLRLCGETTRYGVRLEVGGGLAPGGGEVAEPVAFRRSRALALALPAELVVEDGAGAASLWLAREPSP